MKMSTRIIPYSLTLYIEDSQTMMITNDDKMNKKVKWMNEILKMN